MEEINELQERSRIQEKLLEADVTPNKYRNEVLYYLDIYKSHPTAGDIFEYMKEKFPYISLATVYNTLNIFLEKKLVIALKPDGNTIHYDSTITDHCHFTCEECGKLIDLKDFPLGDGKQRRKLKGNIIKRIVTYVFGICAECNEKSGQVS